MTLTRTLGRLLSEGAARRIYELPGPEGERVGKDGHVVVQFTDGTKTNRGTSAPGFEGKAVLSNQIAVQVFALLRACGIPVSFVEARDETSYFARRTEALFYRVVARREAHGSYCRRHPHLAPGQRLPELVVEFFLETEDATFDGHTLPCRQPLLRLARSVQGGPEALSLWSPDQPALVSEPLVSVPLPHPLEVFQQLAKLTADAFLVLQKAWQLQSVRLADLSLGFGRTSTGEIVVSEIDGDCARLVSGTEIVGNVGVRPDSKPESIALGYQRVLEGTRRFTQPDDTLVLWRASERDDIGAFHAALKDVLGEHLSVFEVCCSAHKQTARALGELDQIEARYPQAVIIAFVGRSNGLGPVLAANTHLPVLCVPASAKDFPDDVWSSLRMPSDVPCSTILDPRNAVLHALGILSKDSPYLSMKLISRKPGYFQIAW